MLSAQAAASAPSLVNPHWFPRSAILLVLFYTFSLGPLVSYAAHGDLLSLFFPLRSVSSL